MCFAQTTSSIHAAVLVHAIHAPQCVLLACFGPIFAISRYFLLYTMYLGKIQGQIRKALFRSKRKNEKNTKKRTYKTQKQKKYTHTQTPGYPQETAYLQLSPSRNSRSRTCATAGILVVCFGGCGTAVVVLLNVFCLCFRLSDAHGRDCTFWAKCF